MVVRVVHVCVNKCHTTYVQQKIRKFMAYDLALCSIAISSRAIGLCLQCFDAVVWASGL